MAPKPAYRRGKLEGGEEPVSKHQIPSRDRRWTGRGGAGRDNLTHVARPKYKASTGAGKGGYKKKSQIGGNSWRANGGGEAEQSGASCDKAK